MATKYAANSILITGDVVQQNALCPIDILRSILKGLEENSKRRPNDPAMREAERYILRTIAELELQRYRAASTSTVKH